MTNSIISLLLCTIRPIVLIAFLAFVLTSCGKDSGGSNPRNDAEVFVNFSNPIISMNEGELDQILRLELSESVPSNTSVSIQIESQDDNWADRMATSPSSNNGTITLNIDAGNDAAEIIISTNIDVDVTSENISFEINSVSGSNVAIGNNNETVLSIVDQTKVNPQYLDCISSSSNNTLELATWNIRTLPQSPSTVDALIQLIPLMEIDIIAVQEIRNPTMFEAVANGIEGWEGKWLDVNGDIELGFLYKASEITSISELTPLFENDFSPFPREAVATNIVHISGLQFKLINIHLKCCSDGADRRTVASMMLKAYIDDNLSDQSVIIAGDFNESITGTNSFDNFLADMENYFFADADIANGSSDDWSFPSFPSHIDHILCTNELLSSVISSETMNLDPCVIGYGDVISDHRPVITRFK